ncbi:MAG TPA: hypothetical protein VEX70_17180 [Pyrinomonadaceae bacterium]|jgi:hypothetical protein|nr:hypothetical protein [Pyrinomonadaceae bacterium]
MHDDEQAETFNQDQQEMFQNPDTNLGETRPRTPGTQNIPPVPAANDEGDGDETSEDAARRKIDNPNLI